MKRRASAGVFAVQVKPGRGPSGAAVAVAILAALCTGQYLPGTVATAAQPPSSVASFVDGRPNILLITMDTVRADHVSVYGYERDTTPALRELARESTVYEHAIASEGFTTPTHASIFTGLYPGWHGATVRPGYPYGAPLPPRSRTLASVLRANGYWTAEAVANYGQLGTTSGLTQGFEFTAAKEAEHLSDSDQPFYLREGAKKLLGLAVSTADFDEYRLRATDINREAFTILEQACNRRTPFFMFLNYMDAHAPYLPPQPFRDRFSAEHRNLKPLSVEAFGTLRDEINAGKRVLDDEGKLYLISQYDAGIAYIDSAIGALLAQLHELGLYQNTLVIITADHGEAFGEHDRMSHATGSLYEDQIHVPLLVKYPGQHDAARSDVLVSQVDFMPTILELAGIALPSGLQGRSLRSAQNRESRFIFSEGIAMGDQRANPRLRGVRRAILADHWKLITWTAGNPELYDLATDAGESNNRYRPGDPLTTALQTRLDAWTAATPKQSPSRAAGPMDPSIIEKLHSLGYIGR